MKVHFSKSGPAMAMQSGWTRRYAHGNECSVRIHVYRDYSVRGDYSVQGTILFKGTILFIFASILYTRDYFVHEI